MRNRSSKRRETNRHTDRRINTPTGRQTKTDKRRQKQL